MRYILIIFAVIICLAVASDENAVLPEAVFWPDAVILEEKVFSYAPVSGSIVVAVMYGDDKVRNTRALALLPRGLQVKEILCFAMESKDGVYVGTGQLQGHIEGPAQIELQLSGIQFGRLVAKERAVGFLAWISESQDCKGQSRRLVATTWSQAVPPINLSVLVNSSGHASRLALRDPESGAFSTFECEQLPAEEEADSRTYDTLCVVGLCAIAKSGRVYIEILNRGQRVHLEPLELETIDEFCG